VRADIVKSIANQCGFELAGIAAAVPLPEDFDRYQQWLSSGHAGKMGYLTDHRADLRRDPRLLLDGARSVICVGKLYNQPLPEPMADHAVISRYAIMQDYHDVLRSGLNMLAERLHHIAPHEWKACVDTAPLLERSYARQAGLGWIGKNTCLINEPSGSWYFLGSLLTTLEIDVDSPPDDRCGTCTRCIDACPTQALLPLANGEWTLDSRRCISYLTIELRGPIPEEMHAGMGAHVFGCDICQEVCPWNARAEFTADEAFATTVNATPPFAELHDLTKPQFEERYRGTPVLRPRFDGFRRNVQVASGNSAVKK
jgi:epoxyqueuosine reductase